MSDKIRAFALPPAPVDHVVIDKRALHSIRDIATKIYVEGRQSNANLILLEALKRYMEVKGAKANFSVLMEGVANVE